MRKIWLAFAAVLFLEMQGSAAEIWTKKTETIITEGVVLTKDVRFSDTGWHRANILEIDTENENLEICTLFDSRGIQKLKTVKAMAEESGMVAAINGDFFNWEGTPLGLTIEGGEVISSPAHDTGLAALLETEEGEFLTAYLDMQLFVECPEGYTAEILHINKYHSMQSMVLYTDAWGGKTPGSHDGVSELVAKDGVVLEVRQDMDGVEVPENGFVLAISTETSTYLVDNFKAGDEITLSYTLTPDLGKLETAIGGGSVLVSGGKVAAFTNVIAGTHPRTAAGIKEDGKTLLFVTVDGRQTATAGMTQTELANYMIELGAVDAINLDGGGSTTMVAREGASDTLSVVNLPSGGERAVATALGVKFVGPQGELETLEVNFATRAIAGEGVHLYLGAYDAHHNPVYIADKPITYSSPDGTFVGNIFYPAHSGSCTVYAECAGIKGTGTIEALPKATPFEKKKPEEGTSVLLLPGAPEGKTFLNILTAARLAHIAEEADIVYTFGENASKAAIGVTKFSSTALENSLFVTIDSKSGIRTQNAAQWRYILEICEETAAKNVFFLLSSPLEAFPDTAEAELFENMLTDTLHGNGKDVFIISTGEKTEMKEKNGIRFVTVASRASIGARTLLEDSLNTSGVRFTLREDAVHFEAVPIWE